MYTKPTAKPKVRKPPRARVLYSLTDHKYRPLDWFNNIPNEFYKMPCAIFPFRSTAAAKQFARVWNMSDADRMKLVTKAYWDNNLGHYCGLESVLRALGFPSPGNGQ